MSPRGTAAAVAAVAAIAAIAATSLRRVLRDRTAVFFMVVFPVALIVIVGVAARGPEAMRVGVLDGGAGALGVDLRAALDAAPAIDTRPFAHRDALEASVRRGELAAGVVLPAGMDEAVRAGADTQIGLIALPASTMGAAARSAVLAALAPEFAAIGAARLVSVEIGGAFEDNLALAARAGGLVAPVEIGAAVLGEPRTLPGGFSYSAPTMLVLFVFVNSVGWGAAIIETRRLGVYDRMLAAPVRARHVVAGEALSHLAFALGQSALIVGLGGVLFGVGWGDPVGAVALVAAWALVGAGAGVLSGTLFATPEQAGAVGTSIAIAMGMLGGTMWPLEIVPPFMQAIGRLVPHFWAVEGWTELIARDGGLGDIALELGVLLGTAAALMSVAAWRLQRRLSA